MKLLASTLLVAALQAATSSAAVIQSRQANLSADCIEDLKYRGWYHNTYSGACVPLIDDCTNKVVDANNNYAIITDNVWGINSCVAAATCTGSGNLFEILQCRQPSFPNATDTISLDYTNIYAPIVGECAWQEGGCPITQQNYIDFVYGAMSAIGSTVWPDSAQYVIDNWWTPITEWTATGDTVPYLNFNDWLHYSNAT